MWPFRRRDHHQELDDEIRAHLEMAERDAIERGTSASEARARARREFGNVPHVKEAVRGVTGWPALDHLQQDLALGVKRLARAPGFSAAAIIMLAVAIGLTTAMFSLLDALVLRPAPFPNAERLTAVMMWHAMNGGATATFEVSPAVFDAWRETPVFDAAEGYSSATSVIGRDHPIMGGVAFVSSGLLPMLGAQPVLGRGLTGDDTRDIATPRAVISSAIWRDQYGARSDALGAPLDVDGKPVTIVGVLPDAFRFPSRETEVWIATDFSAGGATDWRPQAVVRRSLGVSDADAMRIATDRAHAADAATAAWEARARPVAGGEVPEFQRRSAALLVGGAVLVFVVLAVNVACLLLVRCARRRRELIVASTLGASRGRLLRQLLAEMCVLTALGGVGGIVLAVQLLAAARALLPAAFFAGSLNPLILDTRALVVATAASALAVIVSGLLPALLATWPSPAWSLAASERAGTDSHRGRLLMRALLIGEVAFACTLLVGAVALVRSFQNLADADRGFDPHGLVTLGLEPGRGDKAHQRATIADAERALRSLPGVTRVAASVGVAWGPAEWSFYDWQPDTPGASPVNLPLQQYHVSSDFFDVYGITLLAGRMFQPDEEATHVIVGERLAAALWPGMNPVGHSFGARTTTRRFEVIGVATDIRRPSLQPGRDMPGMYTPIDPNVLADMFTIKCGDACPSEAVIRTALRAAAPAAPVYQVARLEDVYASDLAQPRATALASSTFSLVALLAAAAGLFSVLSYAVGRRRREFGIRVALGCSPATIRRLVMRDGLTIALAGVTIGSALAWIAARLLASLEYGVSARDPLNWLVVVAAIAAAALAACWRPAEQAMRVDPAMLLREE
jgi:predicted permease